MTIYWIDNPDKKIDAVPHMGQFKTWTTRLSSEEIDAINAKFAEAIESRETPKDNILTSSWLPGELSDDGDSEWAGTPFWPIYEKACRKNVQHSSWCFGLLLWSYMMGRDDDWICGQFDNNGVPIGGTTYFEKPS